MVLINIAHALLQKQRLGLRNLIRIRYALGAGELDCEYLGCEYKAARTMRRGIQRLRQKSGLHRQKAMLITFSGLDGGGKSTQAQLLRDAFAASHVRSQIVWMRIGDTRGMNVLRSVRRRHDYRKASGNTKRTFDRAGWRLVLWVILASVEYAAWLQYVRWLLWRGEVVIADRYLCDFEVELRFRLQKVPLLATTLLRVLAPLAPKPSRSYLLQIDPELSRRRKPEPDFRGLDPADLRPGYGRIARHYDLRVFESSQPVEEVADAVIHDVLTDYLADSRALAPATLLAGSRRLHSAEKGHSGRG